MTLDVSQPGLRHGKIRYFFADTFVGRLLPPTLALHGLAGGGSGS